MLSKSVKIVKNIEKLSEMVNIFRSSQTCKKLYKTVKIVEKGQELSKNSKVVKKIVKIVTDCQNLSLNNAKNVKKCYKL